MPLLPADGQLVWKKPNVTPLGEKAGGDDDTSEDSGKDDIDATESSFIDNSNIDGRVLEGPILNPPDVNMNDILDPDDFDDVSDIDNADQDNVDDPEIVEVPPTADSTSGQQVRKPASLKRRHSETESNTSRKSRATDMRKALPKLVQGSTQSPRTGFASAFLESSSSKLEGTVSIPLQLFIGVLLSNHTLVCCSCCVWSLALKEVEEKKLEQEKDSSTRQLELDRKRMELEERKLEAEKEQAERKLEAEQRSEDRMIGLEEKRLQWGERKIGSRDGHQVQSAVGYPSTVSHEQ